MVEQDLIISRTLVDLFNHQVIKNLDEKRLNKDFQIDMYPLLPHTMNWDFDKTFDFVQNHVVAKLAGANLGNFKTSIRD